MIGKIVELSIAGEKVPASLENEVVKPLRFSDDDSFSISGEITEVNEEALRDLQWFCGNVYGLQNGGSYYGSLVVGIRDEVIEKLAFMCMFLDRLWKPCFVKQIEYKWWVDSEYRSSHSEFRDRFTHCLVESLSSVVGKELAHYAVYGVWA